MNKTKEFRFRTPQILYSIFLTIALCNGRVNAQNSIDSSHKGLTHGVNKKPISAKAPLESNIVFPVILTGNEDQSLDYIEKFSAKRRDYLIRTYNRSKKFFPKAAAILKKKQLPEEFKVLLALESAFNPNAVSKAGAVGYWQFMDNVAKEYGLKCVTVVSSAEKKKLIKKNKKKADAYFKNLSKQKDDRKNFNKSTYAAAQYLKDRSRNLNNDWLLIAASYNCGVGNVWEAMASSGKKNPTFWDIKNKLPAETRSYVMNFIAMNVIFNNYEKFASNSLCFKSAPKNTVESFEENVNEVLAEPSPGNN